VTKRISLVVTYDTDSETSIVDVDASRARFPEGLCWDDELDRWVDDPGLVDKATRRLVAQLRTDEWSTSPGSRAPVRVETKFIELALNIIDPDGAWDPEETLEFADAARVYLSEYPITNWELEGAFALVAQFVHDWALGETHLEDGTSLGVDRVDHRIVFQSVPTGIASKLERPSSSSESVIGEMETDEWLGRTSLETEDPLSRTTLRMIFGDYEGAPTLALFVGDDEEPILIDRSALQIAIDQGWATVNDSNVPVLSFRPNSDGELDAIDFDIDLDPMFE
jgi:hypothetical protein